MKGKALSTGWPECPRVWRALRLTVTLLLVATALGSTVAHAQDGVQAPGNEQPLELEPPVIAPAPAGPGEVLHIANVSIASPEQLALLQRLGYSCDEAAVCEIVAPEAQLSALREGGHELEVVGLMAESVVYGANETNYKINDYSQAVSIITITSAPATAKVTRVKYSCRVDTYNLAGPDDYTVDIRHLLKGPITIWNRLGGDLDEGYDDDGANDDDIHLDGRWINAHFDGQMVNVPWLLTAKDYVQHFTFGTGLIDYWRLWVYYCTEGPYAPALTSPGSNVHTCDTTPYFDWASVSGTDYYHIQVDDSSSFSSPAIAGSVTASNHTPSSPLARKKWYWHVRAHNECGYGPWSPTRSFTIDSSPAVPVLQSPADGSHTCDRTPLFDWQDAPGALQYRIEVDDSAGFSSPAISTVRTASDFTPTAELPTAKYYWRVRSESACGQGAWSAVRSFRIDSSPGAPVLLAPANGSHTCDRTPLFDWQDAAGALQYRIEVDDSAGFSSPAISTVRTASELTPAAELPPAEYYWRVRGEGACGQGAWSPVRNFHIDPGPATPAGPSPANGATGVGLAAGLQWSAAVGATSYDVYFGTAMPPPEIGTTSGTWYDLPALAGNTLYRWKIVAENACGRTHGPVWSFTTAGVPPPEHLVYLPVVTRKLRR